MQTQRAILDIRLGFVGPLLPPAKEQQPLIDGLCRPLQACCDGNRGLAGRAQFEQPAVPHVLFLFRSMTGCQLAFRLAGDLVAFVFWPSSVAFPLPACGHRPRCWDVTHRAVCRRCWSRFLRSCNWLTLSLCLKQLLERRFVVISNSLRDELVNLDVRVDFKRNVLKLILRHLGSARRAFRLPGAARACQVEEERPRRFKTMLAHRNQGLSLAAGNAPPLNLRRTCAIVPAPLLARKSKDPSPPDGANFSNPDAQPRPLVRYFP